MFSRGCRQTEVETKDTGRRSWGAKDKLIKKPATDDVKNQSEVPNGVWTQWSKGHQMQPRPSDHPESNAKDEETMVQHPRKDGNLVLKDVNTNFLKEGIPAFWMDRIKMQNAYSLEAKGWKVQVNWGQSSISGAGVGAFIGEDVEKGQLLRVAQTGKNLIRFRDQSDLPKNMSSVTMNYISNYCGQVDDFTMIFLPGNCFNHSDDANTDMIPADEETIHLIAARDVKAGKELTQNYYTFGEPPKYLKDLAKNETMDLVFPGYNTFL